MCQALSLGRGIQSHDPVLRETTSNSHLVCPSAFAPFCTTGMRTDPSALLKAPRPPQDEAGRAESALMALGPVLSTRTAGALTPPDTSTRHREMGSRIEHQLKGGSRRQGPEDTSLGRREEAVSTLLPSGSSQ